MAIQEYVKRSRLMDITISYGGEEFHFNLFEEARINENIINKEIKSQPSSYGFLSLLHKKLIRAMEDRKRELEKAYARNFIIAKQNELSDSGRPPSDEMAKCMAIDDNDYQAAYTEWIKAKEDAGIIETCVKTFEERGQLIQTLSANLRKT